MQTINQLKTLREMEDKKLLKELSVSYDRLRKLNFDIKFRKHKNLADANNLRKKIARIWTILGEKLNEKH